MFIELTTDKGSKILVNTNMIVDIHTTGNAPYVYKTVVSTIKGLWEVKESYEEIKDMMFK